MFDFTSSLIVWYKQYKRDLPWRETKDPYKIWVSEIILQQTRVNQGLNYYISFLEAFPTVIDLANASEDNVLKIWQGLGYYSRARNMHAAAKMIKNELGGIFPDNYKDLLQLKGVGEYTAAAISSICFNEHQTVLDGNVFRLLSRLYGLETPINSTKGKKEFYELAHSLNNTQHKGTFNQALMEYGATMCTPKAPDCHNCIFKMCYAFNNNLVDKLPVKESRISIKKRNLYFFYVLQKDKYVAIERREGKDIWKGLYQFPLVEIANQISIAELLEHEKFRGIFGDKAFTVVSSDTINHVLTHQRLLITIIKIKIEDLLPGNWILVPVEKLTDYAYPVPLASYIDKEVK